MNAVKNKDREVRVGPYCERSGRPCLYCTARGSSWNGERYSPGGLWQQWFRKTCWNLKWPEQDQQKASAIIYTGCVIVCEDLSQEGKGGHSLGKDSKNTELGNRLDVESEGWREAKIF